MRVLIVSHNYFATIWVYLWLAFGGVAGAAGDALLNRWAKDGDMQPLILSAMLWLVAVACFAVVLKVQAFPFGAAVVLGLLVHICLAVVFDRIWFGGRLTCWQWVGIACAMAAIILIGTGTHHNTDTPMLSRGV